MTTRRQVSPVTQRQAEQAVGFSQGSFGGMTKDVPTTEVSDKYSFRNVNCVDHGQYFEGRAGTRRYGDTGTTGIDYDVDHLNGRHFNRLTKKIFSHCGNRVFCHDADFSNMQEVICVSTDLPNDLPSMFDDFEDDVVLFANGIWRVYQIDTVLFMTKVNGLNPSYKNPALLASTDPFYYSTTSYPQGGLGGSTNPPTNSYRYITSYARIEGNKYYSEEIVVNQGISVLDRKQTGFLFETGTMLPIDNSNEASPFYELWSNESIGDYAGRSYKGPAPVFSGGIGVGELKTLSTRIDVTHHCIYRTKNIGFDSGNNPAQYTWVADVPVAAVISSVDIFVATYGPYVDYSYARREDIPEWMCGNKFKLLSKPVGCTSTYVKTERMDVLDPFFPDNPMALRFSDYTSGLALPAGKYEMVLGEGNSARATYNSTTKRLVKVTGDNFSAGDVGKTIFFGYPIDGSGLPTAGTSGYIDVISEYVDASTIILKHGIPYYTGDVLGFTWSGANGFSVKYFDQVLDDGKKIGEEGLYERVLSSNTLYTPQYAFKPIANGDVGCITNGYLFAAKRGEQWISYTAIGDKPYQLGCHRDDIQFDNLHGNVSTIVKQSGFVSIVCTDRIMFNDLTTPVSNMGETTFGEYIPQLNPFAQTDMRIGCRQWRTLIPVAPGKWMGVTSEPAVRMFDGKSWSKDNYAAMNNVPAIMDDLRSVGPCELMAAFSDRDGYLLFGERYTDAELVYDDEIIVEDIITEDWVDVGGTHEATAFPRYLDVGGVRT